MATTNSTPYKKLEKLTGIFLAAILLLFFVSCKKDIDNTTPPINNNDSTVAPDLSSKVSSSVSGFVTDENNAAVSGASVKVGAFTTTSDEYGFFQVKNVEVVKNAAVVTVEKSGYFKGIKTYIAAAGKSAFFRIKLLPKTIVGTIGASAGGEVTLTTGMKISLPSNAVVTASGAAYTGTVSVAASWIDPTSNQLNQIMPGDLRGIADGGALKLLTTYGMAAVELTGASGESLQIASGKTSTLTMPVPASILGSAPASIPLWSFNEANGLWKQEGSGVKTGNTYVGEVSHFSFWNYDVPGNYVQFNCTVVDPNNQPVPFAFVKISVVGSPNNSAYGYTDSAGYVSGAVPNNASLLLEIYSHYACGTNIHSQNFSTTTTDISLGNITVNNNQNIASVSGTVTDCASNPVTNGYLIMFQNGQYHRYGLNSSGAYSYNTFMCSGTSDVTLIAEDNASAQQSTPLNYTLTSGANAISNLQACGVTTSQFLNYTINGTSYSYTSPADSFYQYVNPQVTPPVMQIFGQRYLGGATSYGSLTFTATGIAAGSTQSLTQFFAQEIQDSIFITAPINVNITEYGIVGEFIAGNFTGTLTGQAPVSATYNINCSFRVRRNN